MKFGKLLLTGAAIILAGCSHHIQTTSGQDYLGKYSDNAAYNHLSKTNAEIYDIAAIEPNLKFPARIGIARIGQTQNYRNNKTLTSIPSDESDIWYDLVKREGQRYGEFVPVSPFIAAMVGSTTERPDTKHIIDNIRKGAARQHLDYVLVYEVTSNDKRKKNKLGFTDATVLGLFLLPSRKVEVDTIATAVLLDVRNGYPYMTASSFSEKTSTTTRHNAGSKRDKLKDKGRVEAIENLSVDVENALQDLKDAAYAQLVAEGY